MGTTLENGVYLPSEGERNCYAGLKTNWEILDQKVADVTALQQAVAGALHRQIVASLPTTDIDPNTIYMILSGTSATENVYNEFMYVNNAWELIGTSATDLTNYYTKAEVDGKLLLKANASDLTSHTGDTTIHVTTTDKNRWNNQTYVFRYSSTSLVASSTNSNTLLDNTDNLKVGDKVIDSSGVLFSITAIDTANSTFTIGTALIDLAQDSDVVHKSGDENISGKKYFRDDLTIYNYDSSQATKNLNISSSKIQVGDTSNSDAFGIRFNAGASYVAQILAINDTTGTQNLQLGIRTKDSSGNFITSMVRSRLSANGNSSFEPGANDSVSLGSSSFKWKSVYATNYYYGNDNVEFSTKFVTTDTAQTISGNKTFSGNVNVYNSDSATDVANIILKNSKYSRGSTTELEPQYIRFLDKTSKNSGQLSCYGNSSGNTLVSLFAYNKDSNNQTINSYVTLAKSSSGDASFYPNNDNVINLGATNKRWSDVQTYKVNNLEPSSLSLPSDRSARIDISSYITNLGNGDNNQYIVPANGYIWLHFTSINSALCYSQTSGGLTNYAQTFVRYQGDGQLYAFFPVRKNDYFIVQIYTSSTAVVQSAYFIPCQGNV